MAPREGNVRRKMRPAESKPDELIHTRTMPGVPVAVGPLPRTSVEVSADRQLCMVRPLRKGSPPSTEFRSYRVSIFIYIETVIFNISDPAFRLALYNAADRNCVWCKEPIVCYADMQIDHLIYKTIDSKTLRSQIKGFELDPTYDVHETYNLAPIHGPCNRGKSAKPLAISALNASILHDARQRAEGVEKKAEANKKTLSADTSKALATLESHRADPQVMQAVRQFLIDISVSEPGNIDSILSFPVLPDLAIAVSARGSVKAFGLGDCPNSNCISGNVMWEAFPRPKALLRSGYCDACGTLAVECPACDTHTSFAWDTEQRCDGCENQFVAETVGGELWDVTIR